MTVFQAWIPALSGVGAVGLLEGLAGLVLAYLMGSVSFAVLMSRVFGLSDPRTYGSGNPGATNVLRSGHRGAAVMTLLGDAFKGVLAVLCMRAWITYVGAADTWVVWAGLAAFLGHLYPIFHRFKGGKGVATAAGVLFALSPGLGLVILACWLLIVLVSRYVSLASMAAAGVAPVAAFLGGWPWLELLPVALMSVFLIGRHRANILKLRSGQESRIGQVVAR